MLADPGRPRLLEATDRLAETMLLWALRTRARAEIVQQQVLEEERARARQSARSLMREQLEAAFGLASLTLLHVMIVDGRLDDDDARALLIYRLRYELTIARRDRLWVLALRDDDGDVLHSRGGRPLVGSFGCDLRGDAAVTCLWCGIAELYALWRES